MHDSGIWLLLFLSLFGWFWLLSLFYWILLSYNLSFFTSPFLSMPLASPFLLPFFIWNFLGLYFSNHFIPSPLLFKIFLINYFGFEILIFYGYLVGNRKTFFLFLLEVFVEFAFCDFFTSEGVCGHVVVDLLSGNVRLLKKVVYCCYLPILLIVGFLMMFIFMLILLSSS